MPQHIGYVALLVRDYDEAISWFTGKLGFALTEDTDLGGGKRWVLVAPPGSAETRILLAKAASASQLEGVGNQAAGRVFLFLHTDDFWRDYEAYRARGCCSVESLERSPTAPSQFSRISTEICGTCCNWIDDRSVSRFRQNVVGGMCRMHIVRPRKAEREQVDAVQQMLA